MHTSIYNWLSKILSERWGIAVELKEICFPEPLVMLNCAGIDLIQFPLLASCFKGNTKQNINCTLWDPNIVGLQSILSKSLPIIGPLREEDQAIELRLNRAKFNFDLLGQLYWLLSRKEETYKDNLLDFHGRFSGKLSHAFQNDYLDRPIVDEWIDFVKKVIQSINPQLKFKKNYFSINVSHDVDSPSRYGFCGTKRLIEAVAGDLFKHKNFLSILKIPHIRFSARTELHAADSYNTFDWLMDVSEENNIKSSFYFICDKTDSEKDADYRMDYPSIKRLLKQINIRGHEIGLHPSYNSYKDSNQITTEFEVLRNACFLEGINQDNWGGRMHFLRWEHPKTMNALNRAGLSYDNTLGYADMPGFRCGTCFEYPAFDPINNVELDLRIRPLIVMECTIIAKRYMNLGLGCESRDVFLDLKEKCNKVDGIYSILWHNSQLVSNDEKQFYKGVLHSS